MHTSTSVADPGASKFTLPRARGKVQVKLRCDGNGETRISNFFQSGCLKVRLPNYRTSPTPELALMNISGGLTGGDRLSIDVAVGEGASATVTTPACEHVYRSTGDEAIVEQRLRVARAGRLDWIPQETIIFDRGRVRRRLDVELEDEAEITIAESVILGRAAMGESLIGGGLSDLWTVRRGGRLLYADAIRIAGSIPAVVGSPTTLRGRRAFASLVHVGRDLAAKRDALRSAFSLVPGSTAGASIIGDILVARVAAPLGASLRHALIPALGALRSPLSLPRLWSC